MNFDNASNQAMAQDEDDDDFSILQYLPAWLISILGLELPDHEIQTMLFELSLIFVSVPPCGV